MKNMNNARYYRERDYVSEKEDTILVCRQQQNRILFTIREFIVIWVQIFDYQCHNACIHWIHMEEYMERFELIAPCHFGLKRVLKKRNSGSGIRNLQVEDGRATFYEMQKPYAERMYFCGQQSVFWSRQQDHLMRLHLMNCLKRPLTSGSIISREMESSGLRRGLHR